MIHLLSPYDTPLLGGVGADGRSALAQGTCFEKKVEWLDETLLTPRSTIATTATTAQTYISVASGDQVKFSTGDVVVIAGETLRVTGWGTTTDTLTVTRGYAGTSATVATSAAVVGVGTALAEGSDPSTARYVDRSNRYNMTEIFGPYAVQISGSENVVRKYGIGGPGGELQHQVANRLKELAIAIEQAVVYGQRVEDTTNKWRTMGGLDYWITTNVDTTTTTLTESSLLTLAQTVFDAGGEPDRVVVGSKQKRIISAFTSSGTIFQQRADNERGLVADYYDSDYGRLSLILDRWYRVSDLHIFNRDQAEINTLRPMVYEQLAKTGDSTKGQVLAEKTLKFRRERHAAKFNALT